jgi:hypothetical protein
MPRAFDKCQQDGGKIRTISGSSEANRKRFGLSKSQYIKVCFLNGKSFLGEKHYKKVKKV